MKKEVLDKVKAIDNNIKKLKEEKKRIFFDEASREIMELMNKQGLKELLLMECRDDEGSYYMQEPFRDRKYERPDEHDEDKTYKWNDGTITYRNEFDELKCVVRLGIIQKKLKMQVMYCADYDDYWDYGEIEDKWIDFDNYNNYANVKFLIKYLKHESYSYDYTKAHPELLLLK